MERVAPLTGRDYTPGGGTALYDAIAEGVRLADKDKTEEERVVCVIMTDGEENSSKETTKQQVKDIISSHEASGDWNFLYIGENPEQWANDTGMSSASAIQFNHDIMVENIRAIDLCVTSHRVKNPNLIKRNTCSIC